MSSSCFALSSTTNENTMGRNELRDHQDSSLLYSITQTAYFLAQMFTQRAFPGLVILCT